MKWFELFVCLPFLGLQESNSTCLDWKSGLDQLTSICLRGIFVPLSFSRGLLACALMHCGLMSCTSFKHPP